MILAKMTCDLVNSVNITRFKLGLALAQGNPSAKFGEATSNISRDIERKQS